jgi:hypothetical protein
MKTLFTRTTIAAAIIQLLTMSAGSAQSPKSTTIPSLLAPPVNVVVDGDIKEWGDSLLYYDKGTRISYAIANDKENLYFAVRIKDRLQQQRVLMAGLSISASPSGKKRNSFEITFPLNSPGNRAFSYNSANPGPVTQKDRYELTMKRQTILINMEVSGFKGINDGLINGINDFGIMSGFNYDTEGYLVCEAVIPLKYFNVADIYKNEWAFNFQVNGVQRLKPLAADPIKTTVTRVEKGTSSSLGRNLVPGAETSDTLPDVFYHTEDFWTKFYLAK